MISTEFIIVLILNGVFGLSKPIQDFIQQNYHQESSLLGNSNTSLTRVPLSPNVRPQYVFTLHRENTTFGFHISESNSDNSRVGQDGYGREFKLSVVVEKMTCLMRQLRPPFLVIEGFNESHTMTKSVKYCSEVDNEGNSYQTVDFVLDDMASVIVKTEGDWTGLSATVVASIYYEVEEGCDNCASDYFCCGNKRSCALSKTHQSHNPWAHDWYRCIPISAIGSGDRQNDLICNRHPNCGFYCNADESKETCSGYEGECVGPDCHLVDVAIKLGVLIVFCFLLPPTVVLIICRWKYCRRICFEMNERAMRRFRRRQDSTTTNGSGDTEDGRHTTSCHHAVTRSPHPSPVPAYNQDDDPPPSYEEYLRSKPVSNTNSKQPEPPPPFPAVIETEGAPQRTEEASEEVGSGIINSVFVGDDN